MANPVYAGNGGTGMRTQGVPPVGFGSIAPTSSVSLSNMLGSTPASANNFSGLSNFSSYTNPVWVPPTQASSYTPPQPRSFSHIVPRLNLAAITPTHEENDRLARAARAHRAAPAARNPPSSSAAARPGAGAKVAVAAPVARPHQQAAAATAGVALPVTSTADQSLAASRADQTPVNSNPASTAATPPVAGWLTPKAIAAAAKQQQRDVPNQPSDGPRHRLRSEQPDVGSPYSTTYQNSYSGSAAAQSGVVTPQSSKHSASGPGHLAAAVVRSPTRYRDNAPPA